MSDMTDILDLILVQFVSDIILHMNFEYVCNFLPNIYLIKINYFNGVWLNTVHLSCWYSYFLCFAVKAYNLHQL
jgi:hypothetical protein